MQIRSPKKLLPPSKLLSSSETEQVIAVEDDNEVPDIVGSLVKGGARITGVLLQREDIEDIEDVFLRLYSETN